MTPEQGRNKIDQHLQRGNGIYARGKGLGGRYFMARVKEAALQVWDGDVWANVPRGAQFNAGCGGGPLFEYEDG